MEIKNLRLQLLAMANCDIEAAKAMEAYVLSVDAVDSVDAGKGPENKKCGCPACVLQKIIELRLAN